MKADRLLKKMDKTYLKTKYDRIDEEIEEVAKKRGVKLKGIRNGKR